MTMNFNANQYQQAFDAKRLKNWEIPRPHSKYPATRSTTTEHQASTKITKYQHESRQDK